MKYLISFMILFAGIQPLQAGSCAMDMDAENSHGAHHAVQSGEQDLSSPTHDPKTKRPACCEPATPADNAACAPDMQCGFCHVGVTATSGVRKLAILWVAPAFNTWSSSTVTPSHAAPPFKPPIS